MNNEKHMTQANDFSPSIKELSDEDLQRVTGGLYIATSPRFVEPVKPVDPVVDPIPDSERIFDRLVGRITFNSK